MTIIYKKIKNGNLYGLLLLFLFRLFNKVVRYRLFLMHLETRRQLDNLTLKQAVLSDFFCRL